MRYWIDQLQITQLLNTIFILYSSQYHDQNPHTVEIRIIILTSERLV